MRKSKIVVKMFEEQTNGFRKRNAEKITGIANAF